LFETQKIVGKTLPPPPAFYHIEGRS
jgi:hypothetical protein